MKQFLRWMRQVLPRGTIVGIAVMCDIAIEAVRLWSLWHNGFASENELAMVRLGTMCIAAMLYGGYRVETFHPARNAVYRKWLESTPWTSGKPLPMGPLHLVPQDVIVIVAMMLLTRIIEVRVLYVPVFFLSSYSICLAYTSWLVGQKLYAYTFGIALGMVIFTSMRPASAFVAALSAAMISLRAIRQALNTFPWDLPWFADGRSNQQILESYSLELLGWPVDEFAPKAPKPWVELIDGIGTSILCTWWFAALYAQGNDQIRQTMILNVAIFAQFACLMRTVMYLKSNRSPISLMGRLITLRPWQSKFDVIFVAPVLASLIGIVGTVLAESALLHRQAPWIGMVIPDWMALPISTSAIFADLLLLLVAGPSLERWRLCGRHRIVFQQAYEKAGLGSPATSKDFVQTA